MKNKIGQIELEWIEEENKHYAFFNNNQAIVFAKTVKVTNSYRMSKHN